jgi:hypothetical protein
MNDQITAVCGWQTRIELVVQGLEDLVEDSKVHNKI